MKPQFAGLLYLVVCTGCMSVADLQRWYADGHRAKLAFHGATDLPDVPSNDFRRGFLAGYRDVASGGEGTPPILPPHHYVSVIRRGRLGEDAAMAWFEGFQYGAAAAIRDGAHHYNFLPISPTFDPCDACLCVPESTCVSPLPLIPDQARSDRVTPRPLLAKNDGCIRLPKVDELGRQADPERRDSNVTPTGYIMPQNQSRPSSTLAARE